MKLSKASYDVIQKAKEFNVMPQAALTMRIRYLKDRIEVYKLEDKDPLLAARWILEDVNEILHHKRAIEHFKEIERRKSDQVTEEEIQRARQFPVELLVEFKRGKSYAWCHEDRNPSLTYLSKKQLAWCPVCDIYFNAIDILIKRDGLTFPEAIRRLQR